MIGELETFYSWIKCIVRGERAKQQGAERNSIRRRKISNIVLSAKSCGMGHHVGNMLAARQLQDGDAVFVYRTGAHFLSLALTRAK